MTKQTKHASSITLTLALLVGGWIWADDSKAADSLEDFQVQSDNPYVDSVSAYHLSFALSAETYNRLHNDYLVLEFPGSFGLELIDSVALVTDHPIRKYRIDRLTVAEKVISFRLRRVNDSGEDDDDGSEPEFVNLQVAIFKIHNPLTTGRFQVKGKAVRGEQIIAGPTFSAEFSIFGIEPSPGPVYEMGFVVENNPFNPEDGPVKFRYNLSHNTDVDFRVFTIVGEEVYSRRFFAGAEGGTSGQNEIEWDGRNHEGKIVLNGVYVAKILDRTNDETASLKLAVLK